MDKHRYQALSELVGQALDLPSEQIDAYLVAHCVEDTALLTAARELVSDRIDTEAFLGKPFLHAVAEASLDDRPLIEEIDGLDGYEVIGKLGEGGMGLVFHARQHAGVERDVAIKLIRFADPQMLERFSYERKALARMEHPNIARIYEAGTTASQRPFFTMELVRGEKITAWAEGQDPAMRLDVFLAVCDAVQHAHQRGIIHRDLKPSNILVTEVNGRPVPKIIDFGVARAVDPRERAIHTQQGQVLGTPAYMAPDQIEPLTIGIDTRTDVYGLGAVLFALMTGRPPFEPKRLDRLSYAEKMRVIMAESPPLASRVSALSSILRGDLDQIIAKALSREKRRRYESAGALAADIRNHLNDQPVTARPPSPGRESPAGPHP